MRPARDASLGASSLARSNVRRIDNVRTVNNLIRVFLDLVQIHAVPVAIDLRAISLHRFAHIAIIREDRGHNQRRHKAKFRIDFLNRIKARLLGRIADHVILVNIRRHCAGTDANEHCLFNVATLKCDACCGSQTVAAKRDTRSELRFEI